jgi:hypothetical protein
VTDAAALARARQSWRAAEARLYPLAMTDVDGYQRAVLLVAAVCDQLREATTSADDLLGCQARAAEYVAAAAEATGASARGLEIDDLFGSAAALRDRELAGETQRRERLEVIDRARAAGDKWAQLHADALGTRVPQLRIHVATGRAVVTELSADPTTGAPALLVATARVDVTTGELGDVAAGQLVATVEEWEQAVATLLGSGP